MASLRPSDLMIIVALSLSALPTAAQVSLAPPGQPLESIVAVINDHFIVKV